MILDLIRKIHKPKYEPFNEIRIDSSILLNNIIEIKKLNQNLELFPVLKSNAYGHGFKEICQILNCSQVKMIAVDSYPEAQIAYKYFKGKVLIIGEMPLEAYKYVKFNRTELVVYKEETLKYLASLSKNINVHLFINSGMNREGIKDISDFVNKNDKYLKKLNINGFCSHFASADEDKNDLDFNKIQSDNFFKALEIFKKAGYDPKHIHMSNSAAILSIKDERFTACRPGLLFYGYNPFSNSKSLQIPIKPALEVYSKISHSYRISKGDFVSYNNDFRAEKDLNIGIIPFGYFEGLNRTLSNKLNVEVLNKDFSFYSQIAGKICMNLSCLNLENNDVENNTKVKIISRINSNPNSIHNLSTLSNISPYELLVSLQANIRRTIIN